MKPRLLRASRLAARWAPLCLLAPLPVLAQALPALTSTPAAGGGTQYSLSMQTLLLMTCKRAGVLSSFCDSFGTRSR